MHRVLIIDDDREVNNTLSRVVERSGAVVSNAFTLTDGLSMAERQPFDVIFLDMRLPDGNGLDILPRLRNCTLKPEVIILTAFSDTDSAEIAINNGAWDYIRKPATLQDMKLLLQRVFEYRSAKESLREPFILKRDTIVGTSQRLREALERLAQAAVNDVNVLITGETGTGKELFAKALHDNSNRAHKSFVVLDCTVLPDTLIESILFGHMKGAFTGADKDSEGLVAQADGGTLFLDEIGELPILVQKKLLRVLQEHRYRPVGSKQEMSSDFRMVAATNRNLEQMVSDGLFREDLLFRLRSFEIKLPPLRERAEDIPVLAFQTMTQFCDRNKIETKGFSPEFFDALKRYGWPGNVRELLNTMDQVLAVGFHDPIIYPKHMPTALRVKLMQASLSISEPANGEDTTPFSLNPLPDGKLPFFKSFMESMEHTYLDRLLSYSEGNISKAAQISGLSRKHLYTLINKHNMK
jgi:two-component system, NtrC family, response regulator